MHNHEENAYHLNMPVPQH